MFIVTYEGEFNLHLNTLSPLEKAQDPPVPIESEIMHGFLFLMCPNERINLPNMIGSFTSGTLASVMAKNENKKIIPLLCIKSLKKPQIKVFFK